MPRRFPWIACSLAGCVLTAAASEPFDRLPPAGQLARAVLILLVVAGLSLGFLALLTLVGCWRPGAIRGGAERLRARPYRSLATGLFAGLLLLVLGLLDRHLLHGAPIGKLGVVILVTLFTVLAIYGAATVAFDIGDRVLASLNSRHVGSVFAAIACGGGLLMLVGLVPLVGQAVQFVAVATGMGAALSLLFSPRRPPPEPCPRAENEVE